MPETSPAPAKPPLLTSATYDRLKAFNQFVLPACGTLYAALAIIWGFPHGKEVVGSIAAITIFVGVILGWAANRYNNSNEKYDGLFIVNPGEQNPNTLEFHAPQEVLEAKHEFTIKVVPPSS